MGFRGSRATPGWKCPASGSAGWRAVSLSTHPPTRYLALSFIGILISLLILLLISLTVPPSFLITHVYFRWVHSKLVEPVFLFQEGRDGA